MPATPTVSTCPHSISDRPGARPSSVATTLGRPGATSCTSTGTPIASNSCTSRRAIAASPAAPGTSVGLTESIATRSRNRRSTVVIARGLYRGPSRLQLPAPNPAAITDRHPAADGLSTDGA